MPFVNRVRCLVGVAIAALSASAASATINPPVIIDGVYHQTTSDILSSPDGPFGCNATGVCYARFGKVPNGKELVVTNVSCRLAMQVGVPGIVNVTLRPQHPNGTILRHEMHLHSVKGVNGFTHLVNGTTLLPIPERHRPILLLYQGNPASNITTGVCGISGRITNAPN